MKHLRAMMRINKERDDINMEFTIHDTPATIVKKYPQASDLFKENKIDFCCGGHIPLQEQVVNKDIDGSELLSQLNKQYVAWKEAGNVAHNWDEVPLEDLVDHIIYHHHAYVKEELPRLGELIERVYNVHGMDHPHLQTLFRLFNAFKIDMVEHMFKEENVVFPLIKDYIANEDEQLLSQMRMFNDELEKEHDDSGDILKQIREITNGFELPFGACGTYQVTYARLAELEDMTFEHIHLENNVLFQRL